MGVLAASVPGHRIRLLSLVILWPSTMNSARGRCRYAGHIACHLASLGIYALISYSVNQRTKEIGIRTALGANSGLVRREVLTGTLHLALVGVALGTLGSFALGKWIDSLLFGTTPTIPTVFLGVSLLLCAVALVAAYVPARRASRVDPMIALRAN
jgi:ABC-type antimicrobial peptide transport system permease subunit